MQYLFWLYKERLKACYSQKKLWFMQILITFLKFVNTKCDNFCLSLGTTLVCLTACLPTLINLPPKLLDIQPPFFQGKVYFCSHEPFLLFCHYLSSLESRLFCVMAIYPPLRIVVRPLQLAHIIPYACSIIAVRHLVQHDICYTRNVIVIKHLVQHEVVATEIYT